MRPCGPIRGHHFSSESTRTYVTCKYWTDMFRCEGSQVGGQAIVSLGNRQLAKLKSICKNDKTSDIIKKTAPELYAKIESECYRMIKRNMAEDVYGDFDFSDPKFHGWRYEQKLRYIMSTADPDVDIRKEIAVGFEITEGI